MLRTAQQRSPAPQVSVDNLHPTGQAFTLHWGPLGFVAQPKTRKDNQATQISFTVFIQIILFPPFRGL